MFNIFVYFFTTFGSKDKPAIDSSFALSIKVYRKHDRQILKNDQHKKLTVGWPDSTMKGS